MPPLEVWHICKMFCWNRLLGLLWSTYKSLIKARDGPHFANSSQLNFAPLLGNHTAAISRNRIQVLGNRTLEEHEIVITLIKNDYCEWYSFHYWTFWFHKHEYEWLGVWVICILGVDDFSCITCISILHANAVKSLLDNQHKV